MLDIEEAGGVIMHVAYCPHTPDGGCTCRKPLPGLLNESLAALDITAPNALMIGDSIRDIQAAHAAGAQAWLVQSGHGDAADILKQARALMPDIPVYDDLASAVDALLETNA